MMEETKSEIELLPYQLEVARAVMDSVRNRKGLTFSVEIARQGGKNEISAYIEMALLLMSFSSPNYLVKCSPTFKPQSLVSMRRLRDRLNEGRLAGDWVVEQGHIIRLGLARVVFLSAEPTANVVGNTAHLLLEIDEAQDVSKEKYNKEFRPMAASANATTVLYGTTWDEATLLEEVKQSNLELERKDGIRRHFHYDWEAVAKYNPSYAGYVAAECARLGENHPLFLTQYRLLPVRGGGGFFSSAQLAQLRGMHESLRGPEAGKTYVAGLDLAGEAETAEELLNPRPRRDAAVLTIAELDFSNLDDLIREPSIRVVAHYRWVGRPHPELYATLVDLLKNVWHCKRVVVDSTGVGEPVASFLRKALGSRVKKYRFTAESKSLLGFNLLAAVNSGRLKIYQSDGSEEWREFWLEMEKAKVLYRPSRIMNFFVPPADGHDDFLMSLSLAVEAAGRYAPRHAFGWNRY